MIKNEEDAANVKFKKVFKPITDPLSAFIKINEKDLPINFTQNSRNNTVEEFNSSMEYENFKDVINIERQSSSNNDSEYYDYTDEDKSSLKLNNESLISLEKDDIINMYENINIPFGVRSENKKLMIGDVVVRLSATTNKSFPKEKKYVVTIHNKRYDLTPGLRELLLRNKPNLKVITQKDK